MRIISSRSVAAPAASEVTSSAGRLRSLDARSGRIVRQPIDEVAVVGELRLLPTTYVPAGWLACAGQVLAVDQYNDLFRLIGNAFGGDGVATFALPDLRSGFPLRGPDAGAGCCVCVISDWVVTDGANPYDDYDAGDPMLGEIRSFAVQYAPSGWLPCHGQTLSIAAHVPLFMLLGSQFGGDGSSVFGLPDLQGRAPWSLAADGFVGWCVSTVGYFAPRTSEPPSQKRGGPWPRAVSGIVGEVKMLLAPTISAGWLPCEGQVLSTAGHLPLASVIGGAFGGDGVATFGLPDLRAFDLSSSTGEPLARYCIREMGQYPNPPSA